jgi:hypothetical protein
VSPIRGFLLGNCGHQTIELWGHYDERLRRFALAIGDLDLGDSHAQQVQDQCIDQAAIGVEVAATDPVLVIVIGLVEPCGIFRRLVIKPLWVFKLVVR